MKKITLRSKREIRRILEQATGCVAAFVGPSPYEFAVVPDIPDGVAEPGQIWALFDRGNCVGLIEVELHANTDNTDFHLNTTGLFNATTEVLNCEHLARGDGEYKETATNEHEENLKPADFRTPDDNDTVTEKTICCLVCAEPLTDMGKTTVHTLFYCSKCSQYRAQDEVLIAAIESSLEHLAALSLFRRQKLECELTEKLIANPAITSRILSELRTTITLVLTARSTCSM